MGLRGVVGSPFPRVLQELLVPFCLVAPHGNHVKSSDRILIGRDPKIITLLFGAVDANLNLLGASQLMMLVLSGLVSLLKIRPFFVVAVMPYDSGSRASRCHLHQLSKFRHGIPTSARGHSLWPHSLHSHQPLNAKPLEMATSSRLRTPRPCHRSNFMLLRALPSCPASVYRRP